MHFTIDPDYVAPDSKIFSNGGDGLIVDCLFSEEEGLLKSSQNDEAVEKIHKELCVNNKVWIGSLLVINIV